MYITQDIAFRIKSTAKLKKVTMKQMLSKCELNINAVSEFSKGKNLSCISLAKIADYLDCSVDYLLGRTDEPSSTSNIIDGNVTGGAVVQGSHHSNVTVSNSECKLTDEETELLRLFNSLDVKRRIKILNLAFALDDEVKAEKNSK